MKLPELCGMTKRELEAYMVSLGEKPFRARQVMKWTYKKNLLDFEAMTDLPVYLRKKLKESLKFYDLKLLEVQCSKDGSSKYAFELRDGQVVESVLIPDDDRLTLCVSSQVGCLLRCKFCLTGQVGFSRNLSVSEIVGQVLEVQRYIGPSKRITNVVFMGMGEPLLNYEEVKKAVEILEDEFGFGLSWRRVTLSTVGIIPELERLFSEGVRCRVAISLNAPDQALRAELMPVSRRYPLEELLEVCRRLPLPPRERITFEYVLIKGVNTSPKDALRLSELLKGIRCKINLIPFNEVPELPFQAPSAEEVEAFQRILLDRGFTAIIRKSFGRDIMAACGQLRGKVIRERRS